MGEGGGGVGLKERKTWSGGGTGELGREGGREGGSREGQFPRWRSAVRVRSEGSAVKAPQ